MRQTFDAGKEKCVVAQFVWSISDGGAETLVKDYALLLDKDKFDVVIIVLRRTPTSANDQVLQAANVRVIPIFKSRALLCRVIQKLNYWWYIPFKLDRILRREKAEVLHIHMDLLHDVGKISGRLKGVRLFYTCHSLPDLLLGKEKRPQEHQAAQKLLKKNGLRIIALHDAMRQEINRMFGIDNTVVIRNGIDFRRFRIPESRDGIRQRLGIPKDAYVVGHVGRFSDVKNHTFLVDVFQELHKRKPNAFLLLVGEGDLRAQVEEKLNAAGCKNDYLILSNRPDVPQLLKAMDVFVFPSKFEGFPLSLLEAQVSGLRCVVSDAVPQEAFQTELAVPVSLNEPPAKWCDIILDKTVKGTAHGDINDYDLNREIKRLEKLYLGELRCGSQERTMP